jgi:hypothetical protein
MLRASSIIAFSIMTVCNLPLGEYSKDTLGTRGHKHPCPRTVGTQVPINTPVQYPGEGRLTELLSFPVESSQALFPLSRWIHLPRKASTNIWRPPFVLRTSHPRWHPSELVRRVPHPSTKQRRQRSWLRKKARPSQTTPPKKPPKTKLSARDSAMNTPLLKPPYAPAAPEDYHKDHLQASLHQRAKT